MALSIGDQQAQSGMTQAIYSALNDLLSPKIPPDQLPDVQTGWKQLAFAVATGVVNHLTSNLEIHDIVVSGSTSLTVSGGSATGTVTLNQTTDTSNHVR